MDKLFGKEVWLEKFDSFYLSGADSKRFLNGITTNNINFDKKNSLKTCWLTPTGILRAILEVHSCEEKFRVLVLQGNTDEIKKYFQDVLFPTDDVYLSETDCLLRLQAADYIHTWRKYSPILLTDNNHKVYCEKHKLKVICEEDLDKWKILQAFPIYKSTLDFGNLVLYTVPVPRFFGFMYIADVESS